MKRDPFVIDIWSQIKFNFFFILGLIVALGVLRWSFGDSFGIIAVGVVVGAATSLRLILFGELKAWRHIKAWLLIGAVLGAVFVSSYFLGWLGVILFLLVILVYKFVKGWWLFMKGMRRVETILFGKALDKKDWKKGEKPSIYKTEDE